MVHKAAHQKSLFQTILSRYDLIRATGNWKASFLIFNAVADDSVFMNFSCQKEIQNPQLSPLCITF